MMKAHTAEALMVVLRKKGFHDLLLAVAIIYMWLIIPCSHVSSAQSKRWWTAELTSHHQLKVKRHYLNSRPASYPRDNLFH